MKLYKLNVTLISTISSNPRVLLQEDMCIKCRHGIMYLSTCVVRPGTIYIYVYIYVYQSMVMQR